MKAVFLVLIVIFLGFGQNAKAFCARGEPCSKNVQYLAQNAHPSPDVISRIQSQFKGRVISVQPSHGGNSQIKVITKKSRIIIVTVNSRGSIISVRD
jgi:hypothetical protein